MSSLVANVLHMRPATKWVIIAVGNATRIRSPWQSCAKFQFCINHAKAFSSSSTSKSDFEYFLLKDEHKPQVFDNIMKHFAPREPLTLGLHLPPEIFANFFRESIEEFVASNLSYGVTYKKTGEFVACRLGKILTRDKPIALSGYNSASDPTLAEFISIMKILEEAGDLFQDSEVNKVAEFAIISVNPVYSGRRIAKTLAELSTKNAEELGCERAISQSTNFITVKILEQAGYEAEKILDCSEIRIDGKEVLDLNAMGNSTLFKIMVKKLKPRN